MRHDHVSAQEVGKEKVNHLIISLHFAFQVGTNNKFEDDASYHSDHEEEEQKHAHYSRDVAKPVHFREVFEANEAMQKVVRECESKEGTQDVQWKSLCSGINHFEKLHISGDLEQPENKFQKEANDKH